MTSLEMLKKINAMAEFNQWCGIEVTVAQPGAVEIQMPWRPEVGQYSGFLHAGLGFLAAAVGSLCASQILRSIALLLLLLAVGC